MLSLGNFISKVFSKRERFATFFGQMGPKSLRETFVAQGKIGPKTWFPMANGPKFPHKRC
jgi:hypothetical protein